MYFHDCCFSFSRRGFHSRSGHNIESTTSVHKIRDLKRCINEKDFKDWIRMRIEKRIEEGKITFFPTINCQHTEVLTTDEFSEISTSQLLCKRYRQLEEEVSLYEIKMDQLRTENRKLLCSSQNWHKLYEEARMMKENTITTIDEENYTEDDDINNIGLYS